MWKKGSVGSVDIDTSNGTISAGVTKEYSTQFAQFVSDTNFYYDASKERPGLEGGLAVTSGSATPSWAPKVSSNGRQLVSTQNPPLSVESTINAAWKFSGTLGFVITITQSFPEGRFPVLPQPALQQVEPISMVQGSGVPGFIKGLLDILVVGGGMIITIITTAGKVPLPVPAAIRQISYAEAARLYKWSPQML